MNIPQYLREVTPLNVLDVFDPSALDNFLSGYNFAWGSGITVIYPIAVPVTLETLDKTLDRRPKLGPDFHYVFNRLCEYWRDPEGCNENQACIIADNLVVLKYMDGVWSGPNLHRCQPLGLWNMTFPLRIGGQIVGVLVGGQSIVADFDVNWREALCDYADIVDWTSCPDQDSQFHAVLQNIMTRVHSNTQQREMLRLLPRVESPSVRENMSVDALKKRLKDFLRFGRMTQQLIDELHKPRKTAAEHQLLHDCDEELAGIDLTEPAQWWQECGRLLETLTEFPEVEAVRVYVRKRSRYHCEVAWPADPADHERLPDREVIPAFSTGQLVAISNTENKELMRKIGLGQENVWGYRAETGAGREVCSTLVVLQGAILEERSSFLVDLCSIICTNANLANLIFRERDADEQYRRKVGLIGHSIRTPLQALQFNLEDLESAPAITTSDKLLEKIKNGQARIRDAREDLSLLLESAVPEMETFDLIEVLLYVLNSMEPIAKKHRCVIVGQGTWPDQILIQGIRYRVQRAFTCLLDNAIKYSYHGQRRDGGGLYEVRVWVVIEDGYVKTIMRNYGIGIPENKLTALREYGVRGDVIDKKMDRLGTGLGLPFAINAFEEFGGWIHLTSIPVESATEDERRAYHRYITTVEAALPIPRRK